MPGFIQLLFLVPRGRYMSKTAIWSGYTSNFFYMSETLCPENWLFENENPIVNFKALHFLPKSTSYKRNMAHIPTPDLPQHINFTYGAVIWGTNFSLGYKPGAIFNEPGLRMPLYYYAVNPLAITSLHETGVKTGPPFIHTFHLYHVKISYSTSKIIR